MPEESRLDRIERLTEQNTIAIGQLTADMREGFRDVAEAIKEMAEAQTMMLRTIDRLAKLWERSPN